jgi:hypothetical protein
MPIAYITLIYPSAKKKSPTEAGPRHNHHEGLTATGEEVVLLALRYGYPRNDLVVEPELVRDTLPLKKFSKAKVLVVVNIVASACHELAIGDADFIRKIHKPCHRRMYLGDGCGSGLDGGL